MPMPAREAPKLVDTAPDATGRASAISIHDQKTKAAGLKPDRLLETKWNYKKNTAPGRRDLRRARRSTAEAGPRRRYELSPRARECEHSILETEGKAAVNGRSVGKPAPER